MNIFKQKALTKNEYINRFERVRAYYGNTLTVNELYSKIEGSFSKEEKSATFKTLLKKYINDINALKEWNNYSQKNK